MKPSERLKEIEKNQCLKYNNSSILMLCVDRPELLFSLSDFDIKIFKMIKRDSLVILLDELTEKLCL